MAAEIVSLNKARKVLQRKAAKAQAAENRVKFGQSKPEREKLQKEAERVKQEFDGKKRED
jgi:flagellin-like hook-associated protein FlgL